MWSPSGRWLSYVVNTKQVWVVRADETEAHEVGAVEVARPDTVAWSPKTDTLAMITRAGLELVPTSSGMFPPPLQNTEGASSVAWSPDGTRIALTREQAETTQLMVLDESGGGQHVVAQAPATDESLRLAGWWPDGTGLLAWRISPVSVNSAFDGADLVSIALSGKQVHLTTMLPYPQWLSWSPDGHHLAVVEGKGREANTGKHLAVCDVAADGCQSVAGSPGTVALDPAWSPDGSQIAYVQADDDVTLRFVDWLRTRELWTMRPDGSEAKRLGALDGVDWLNWSPDGRRLLAVGGENALWLVDPTFVSPVASPLAYGGNPAVDFYSFVDWSQTLAWDQG
jgi:TolB protein